MSIRKVVFPVAGLGTRFLPATKVIPKEMLPVVDKPLMQYAVEEALAAGITDFIFITARGKGVIEDHFDKAYELETELARRGKDDMLERVTDFMPEGTTSIFIRQQEALGLGHAVLCARAAVGNEPFAVVLPDDLIAGNGRNVMQQMVDVYDRQQGSVVAVERVPKDQTDRYGIVETGELQERVAPLTSIVEKPKPAAAPSNLAVVGRYILTPRIFELLQNTRTGAGNEIQLTDAISALLAEESIYSYEFDGTRYDCGNKLGYLQATLNYGIRHAEVGEAFREYLDGWNNSRDS
ncbi:UTP--glucose-1-phosphate uridylyltransferase [Methylohalomonas lacus]|uniref:UTP--glucose-1-phosphate uridylyltransferase n=1 Tax=Methylohalomonas lacus TaxID=398773 RepID=A0AAE3L607_9GAMM|nr:UTP--glucose-1-phosphate uridylyltransferase GalU [Methylohalomonas lacus]MCS3904392.1 UTP--glucose-1-phosphate uridylyltransferase [Methylohalomonas lacus]